VNCEFSVCCFSKDRDAVLILLLVSKTNTVRTHVVLRAAAYIAVSASFRTPSTVFLLKTKTATLRSHDSRAARPKVAKRERMFFFSTRFKTFEFYGLFRVFVKHILAHVYTRIDFRLIDLMIWTLLSRKLRLLHKCSSFLKSRNYLRNASVCVFVQIR